MSSTRKKFLTPFFFFKKTLKVLDLVWPLRTVSLKNTMASSQFQALPVRVHSSQFIFV